MALAQAQRQKRVPEVVPVDHELGPLGQARELADGEGGNAGRRLQQDVVDRRHDEDQGPKEHRELVKGLERHDDGLGEHREREEPQGVGQGSQIVNMNSFVVHQ